MSSLTHLNPKGDAHMVDVSEKAVTARRAVTGGKIYMNESAFSQLVSDRKSVV